MELISALSSARSVARFVEGGDLEAAIADISPDSADEAIATARYARDAKSQVWSAVNDLEQAPAATRASYRRRGVKHLAVLRYGRLVRDATYILEVTAICYRSQVRAIGLGMVNLPTSVVEIPTVIRHRGEIDVAEPTDVRAFLGRQP